MGESTNNLTKDNLIKYIKSLGIDVRTNTKARGHSGFCTGKRIDISKELSKEKVLEVLLHEFAHLIHYEKEPRLLYNHGTISAVFDTEDISEIERELVKVTEFVFDDILEKKLIAIKSKTNEEIKKQREVIKKEFPKFKQNEKFKEFNRYVRFSDLKHLVKYDRVLLKGILFKKDKIISVKTLGNDYPNIPEAFAAYIRMKSQERKRSRINARLSRVKRYLRRPSELFARFIQSYFLYPEQTKEVAPTASARFSELKNKGFYPYLNSPLFTSR